MILNLNQLLLDRLKQQGVNTDEAPALLRDLSKILESIVGVDPATASSRLQLLGCNSVALDYPNLICLVFEQIERVVRPDLKKYHRHCRRECKDVPETGMKSVPPSRG